MRSGWLFIDILAIFPFDVLNNDHFFQSDGSSDENFDSKSTNQVIRIARIGRLYKIIKLMKLIRLVRIAKEKSKIFKLHPNDLRILRNES